MQTPDVTPTLGPKHRQWVPVATNQFRLRHLRQVCGRAVGDPDAGPEASRRLFYYTLHVTLMSAPFYTSEALSGCDTDWQDLDRTKFPENLPTCCSGVVVRLWCCTDEGPRQVTVWGVFFSGLVFLGRHLPARDGRGRFPANTLVFGTAWGWHAAPDRLPTPTLPTPPPPPAALGLAAGYDVATLCRVHRMERAIHKQRLESERLRNDMQVARNSAARTRTATVEERHLLDQLQSRRQVAVGRVSLLNAEKAKQSRRLEQLKEALKSLRVENHTRGLHVKEKQLMLQMDKERLAQLVRTAAGTEEALARTRQQLALRRRQLLRDVADVLPITVGGVGGVGQEAPEQAASIHGVALPHSERLAGVDEIQLGVALGHVAHFVHILSILLQVPNRYPVLVCSSRSRIVDPMTSSTSASAAASAASSSASSDRQSQSTPAQRGADADLRQFPLFAKGKDRLSFEYGVYLLNKNIAQLRWLFQLNTQDLAATLPNLAGLVQRLVQTPALDEVDAPSLRAPSPSLAAAAAAPRRPASLHDVAWRHSQTSLNATSGALPDVQVAEPANLDAVRRLASAFSTSTASLAAGSESPPSTLTPSTYFKRPPSPSSASLLDLAVDQLRLLTGASTTASTASQPPAPSSSSASSSPLPSPPSVAPAGESSASPVPDVDVSHRPESGTAAATTPKSTGDAAAAADVVDVVDVELDSVSARTEALASTSLVSFKLQGRRRIHPATSSSLA